VQVLVHVWDNTERWSGPSWNVRPGDYREAPVDHDRAMPWALTLNTDHVHNAHTAHTTPMQEPSCTRLSTACH
jgi:hypothetical protein